MYNIRIWPATINNFYPHALPTTICLILWPTPGYHPNFFSFYWLRLPGTNIPSPPPPISLIFWFGSRSMAYKHLNKCYCEMNRDIITCIYSCFFSSRNRDVDYISIIIIAQHVIQRCGSQDVVVSNGQRAIVESILMVLLCNTVQWRAERTLVEKMRALSTFHPHSLIP